MMREMCRTKIHAATVTEANLYYLGSITIDKLLMESADILPYEKVQVVNNNNGERMETYAIPGEPGSGTICLNGAAARHVHVGDKVIVMAFSMVEDVEARRWKPRILFVDDKNRLTERKASE